MRVLVVGTAERHHERASYTAYRIRVQRGRSPIYEIERRFSELKDLHRIVSSKYANALCGAPALPPHRWVDGRDSEVVRVRRIAFQALCDAMLADDACRASPELAAFLMPEQHGANAARPSDEGDGASSPRPSSPPPPEAAATSDPPPTLPPPEADAAASDPPPPEAAAAEPAAAPTTSPPPRSPPPPNVATPSVLSQLSTATTAEHIDADVELAGAHVDRRELAAELPPRAPLR